MLQDEVDHLKFSGCTNVLPVQVSCCVWIDFCIMLFFFINLQRDKWNFKFLWHFCQYMQIKTDLPCNMINSLLQETRDRILILKFLI